MLPKIEKWIQGSLDLSVPLKTDDDLLVNPQEIEEDISNRVGWSLLDGFDTIKEYLANPLVL